MKKLLFVLSIIITTFCSCQEDETINKNKIVGEWDLTRVEFCDNNGNVIFEGLEDCGETWTHLSVSDATLIATIDYDAEDIESYLYQIKDNTLSLVEGGWSFNCNIEKLSKKELVITYPDEMFVDDSDELTEGIIRMYYKKK